MSFSLAVSISRPEPAVAVRAVAEWALGVFSVGSTLITRLSAVFNSLLFLLTPGVEASKAGTLVSALVAFKRLHDDNALIETTIPRFVAAQPQRYRGLRLRDLCQEMHAFFARPQTSYARRPRDNIAREVVQRKINRVWQRRCIRAKFFQFGDKLPRGRYREQNVDLWEAGCSGPEWALPFKAIASQAPPAYYSILAYNLGLGALTTVCAAAIPWLFFVTVGWIAAGLTRF